MLNKNFILFLSLSLCLTLRAQDGFKAEDLSVGVKGIENKEDPLNEIGNTQKDSKSTPEFKEITAGESVEDASSKKKIKKKKTKTKKTETVAPEEEKIKIKQKELSPEEEQALAEKINQVEEKPEQPLKAERRKVYPPVLKNLPDSLPPWEMIRTKAPIVFDDNYKFDIKNIIDSSRPIPYVVLDTEIYPDAKVISIEDNYRAATEGMYVYIQFESAPDQRGRMLALKQLNTIKTPKWRKGTIVQFQAEIDVITEVNPTEHIYRAKVGLVANPVEVGAKLIFKKLPMYSTNKSNTIGTSMLEVVSGAPGYGSYIFGRDSIIFLEGGLNMGAQVDQMYSLYSNPNRRSGLDIATKSYKKIGDMKIISVSNMFSTAIVLNSDQEIRPGDRSFPNDEMTALGLDEESQAESSEGDLEFDEEQ